MKIYSINSMLNLNFMKRSRAVAFANDILIIIRRELDREPEIFGNKMRCLKAWSRKHGSFHTG